MWTGPLRGLEREFTLTVEYGLPIGSSTSRHRLMPVVRVLNPRLVTNFEAEEEAPLPHVYFEGPDIALSPLCLFDPEAGEWDRTMLIADTTIPWAARWLAAYEITIISAWAGQRDDSQSGHRRRTYRFTTCGPYIRMKSRKAAAHAIAART